MMRSFIAGCAAVLLVTAAPVAEQTPPPSSGAFVELDVSVTDKNGIVTDLRQEDFQVQDDGKKVEIKSFTSVLARGTTAPGVCIYLFLVL